MLSRLDNRARPLPLIANSSTFHPLRDVDTDRATMTGRRSDDIGDRTQC